MFEAREIYPPCPSLTLSHSAESGRGAAVALTGEDVAELAKTLDDQRLRIESLSKILAKDERDILYVQRVLSNR